MYKYFNSKKKLCLVKNKNIFDTLYKNIYTIKYQKCGFFYLDFLIFLKSANKFLKFFYIDKVIYAKFLIIEINSIGKLIWIIISVILHNLYR